MYESLPDDVILADNLGLKLVFKPHNNMVELELGAIAIKLSPDKIQRVANLLMKASLKLDKVEHELRQSESARKRQLSALH